jgi:hypothetical protein
MYIVELAEQPSPAIVWMVKKMHPDGRSPGVVSIIIETLS